MANDDDSERPVSPQQEDLLGSGGSGDPSQSANTNEKSKIYRPVLPGNVANELQQSINEGLPNLHSPSESPPRPDPQGVGGDVDQPPPVAAIPETPLPPVAAKPNAPLPPAPAAPDPPHGPNAEVSGGSDVPQGPPPVAPKPVRPRNVRVVNLIEGDDGTIMVDPSQKGHFKETFVDPSVSSLEQEGDERVEEDLTRGLIQEGVSQEGQVGSSAMAIPALDKSEGKPDANNIANTSTGSSSHGVPIIRVEDFGGNSEVKEGDKGQHPTVDGKEGTSDITDEEERAAIDLDRLAVYNTLYRIGNVDDTSDDDLSSYDEDESEYENESLGDDDADMDEPVDGGVDGMEEEGFERYEDDYDEEVLEEDVFEPEETEMVEEEPESYLGFFARKLKSELNQLKKDGTLNPEDPEADDARVCYRCRKELGFIFDSGEICPKCKSKVCKECQVFTPTGKNWLCKFCDKQLKIKIMNPDWVGSKRNEDRSTPSIHGSELVRVSLENSRANSTATSMVDENEDRKRYYEDDLSYSDEESESFGSEDYRKSPGRNVTFDSPLRQTTIPSDLGDESLNGPTPVGATPGTKHWHARSRGWGPHPQFASTGHRHNSSGPQEHLDNRYVGSRRSGTYDFPESYNFTITPKVATIKRTEDFSPLAPLFVWPGHSRPQANSIDSGTSLTCSTCSNGVAEDDIDNQSVSDRFDGSDASSDDEGAPVNVSTQTSDDLMGEVYLDGSIQEVDAPVDFKDYVVLDKVEEAFIFCNTDGFNYPRHKPRKLKCDLVGYDAEIRTILERDSPESNRGVAERKKEWNFLPKFYPREPKKKLIPNDMHIFVPVGRARPLPDSEPSSSSDSTPLNISENDLSSSAESVVNLDEKFSDNVSLIQSLLSESTLTESRDGTSENNTEWKSGEGERVREGYSSGEEDEGGWIESSTARTLDSDLSHVSNGSEYTAISDLSHLSNSFVLPREKKLLKAPNLNFADFEDDDYYAESESTDFDDFSKGPTDLFNLSYRLQQSSESDLSVILEDPEEDRPIQKTVSEESEEGAEEDRYYDDEEQHDYTTPHRGERVPVDVHPNGKTGLYKKASPTPKRIIDTTPRLKGDEWEQMLNGKLKDASSSDEEKGSIMEEKEIKKIGAGIVSSSLQEGVGDGDSWEEDSGVVAFGIDEDIVAQADLRNDENEKAKAEGDPHDSKIEVIAIVENVGGSGGVSGDDLEKDKDVTGMVQVDDPDDSDLVVIDYGETQDSQDAVNNIGTTLGEDGSEDVEVASRDIDVSKEDATKGIDEKVDEEGLAHGMEENGVEENGVMESSAPVVDVDIDVTNMNGNVVDNIAHGEDTHVMDNIVNGTAQNIDENETMEDIAPVVEKVDMDIIAQDVDKNVQLDDVTRDADENKGMDPGALVMHKDIESNDVVAGINSEDIAVDLNSKDIVVDENQNVDDVTQVQDKYEDKGDVAHVMVESVDVDVGVHDVDKKEEEKDATLEDKGADIDSGAQDQIGDVEAPISTQTAVHVETEVSVVQPSPEGDVTEPEGQGTQAELSGDGLIDVTHGAPYEVPVKSSTLPAVKKEPYGLDEDASGAAVRRSNSGAQAKIGFRKSLAAEEEDTILEEKKIKESKAGMIAAAARLNAEGDDKGKGLNPDLQKVVDSDENKNFLRVGEEGHNENYKNSQVTEVGNSKNDSSRGRTDISLAAGNDINANDCLREMKDQGPVSRDKKQPSPPACTETDLSEVDRDPLQQPDIPGANTVRDVQPDVSLERTPKPGTLLALSFRRDEDPEIPDDGLGERMHSVAPGEVTVGSSSDPAEGIGEWGREVLVSASGNVTVVPLEPLQWSEEEGDGNELEDVRVDLHVENNLNQGGVKSDFDIDGNMKVTHDTPPGVITKASTLPYRKKARRVDSHSGTMVHQRSSSYAEANNGIADDDEAHRTSTVSLYSNAEESYRLPVTGDVNFGTSYNYKTNTFEVKVLSCRDLVPVDAKRNRSNAYVKLYLLPDRTKQSKRKTTVKKGTINPVFSETLKYKIMQSELETRTLCVAVWHHDRFGHNLFLGEHLLSLDTIQFDEYLARWHPLAQRQRHSTSALTYTGDVLVAIMYEPLSDTEEQDRETKYHKGRKNKAPGRLLGGTLHVQVKEAKNLVGSKLGGAPSPTCKCYLLPDRSKSGKKKTSSKKNTCNPKWSDILLFENVTRDSLLERCLEVTVWDYDTVGSNSCMGGVRLGLGSGKSYGKAVNWMDSSGKEVSVWREMLKHPGHWVETFMTLRGNVGKTKKK